MISVVMHKLYTPSKIREKVILVAGIVMTIIIVLVIATVL